jgi:hypothetical protein
MSLYSLDVPALWNLLDRKRRILHLSWRDLATKLDISASTFTRMGSGKCPDADALMTMFVWLNMDTDIVYVVKQGAQLMAAARTEI